MNQQQIYDRRGVLNRELHEALARAETLERMKQKAERQDLMDKCGAIGHVMVHGSEFLGGLKDRCCASCGKSEHADTVRLAEQLTKVSPLPP